MATIASRFSSDRARGDGATERARLQRLAAVDAGRHRVVTCYQKLEPRDRSRGKYLIKLKNRVKEVVQALPRLGLDHARGGLLGACCVLRQVQNAHGRTIPRLRAKRPTHRLIGVGAAAQRKQRCVSA